jgi:hypothetical protein
VVEYYGAPAVTSTKIKHDPDLPIAHWWIIEPVAQAIATAGQLSPDESDLAFTGLRDVVAGEGFLSRAAVNGFIRHVNQHRHSTGLPLIPASHVTPNGPARPFAAPPRTS